MIVFAVYKVNCGSSVDGKCAAKILHDRYIALFKKHITFCQISCLRDQANSHLLHKVCSCKTVLCMGRAAPSLA